VAADERQARGAGGPDVLVGVTQPGRSHADENLAGLGLVQVQFGDFPWLAALAEHRRPGLHHLLLPGGRDKPSRLEFSYHALLVVESVIYRVP